MKTETKLQARRLKVKIKASASKICSRILLTRLLRPKIEILGFFVEVKLRGALQPVTAMSEIYGIEIHFQYIVFTVFFFKLPCQFYFV